MKRAFLAVVASVMMAGQAMAAVDDESLSGLGMARSAAELCGFEMKPAFDSQLMALSKSELLKVGAYTERARNEFLDNNLTWQVTWCDKMKATAREFKFLAE